MSKYVVAKMNEVVVGALVIFIPGLAAQATADILNDKILKFENYFYSPAEADRTATVVCREEDLKANNYLHMDPIVLPPMTHEMIEFGASEMAKAMRLSDSRVVGQKYKHSDTQREAWSAALRARVDASKKKEAADAMIYVDRDFDDWE